MVYDRQLADRVRATLAEHTDFDEKAMFGGLAFMVNTHMACGMVRDDLLVRVGADGHDDALSRGATQMVFSGQRPMRGMVLVPAALVADDEALDRWVTAAVELARSQPAKVPKPPRKPRAGS